MRTRSVSIVCLTLALGAATAAIAGAQTALQAARVVLAPESRLADLVLVRISEHHAVVRFGTGPLLLVEAGDRLGKSAAEVVAVAAGRLELEERYANERGTHTARLVFTPGVRGATKYLARPDEGTPASSRPVTPARKPGA